MNAASTAPTSIHRRAADIAYDRIESLISRLQIQPGSPVVEAELAERTGLGRTPVREALMRMVASGLILQQPRRGMVVSHIDAMEHMDILHTRRVLECLIASNAARRATEEQRKNILVCAKKMVAAGHKGNLDDYMAADQALDHVIHAACGNPSAVKALAPLVVQCRRFWYAYQRDGETAQAAQHHLTLAQAIAQGDAAQAAQAAHTLMDYLEHYAKNAVVSR